MSMQEETKRSLIKVLKLFLVFIALIIVYRLTTNLIDERCTYHSVKTFYHDNAKVFTAIERYLQHTYKDSLNVLRTDGSQAWNFRINNSRVLFNKNIHTYDPLIDSCLQQLHFNEMVYDGREGSIWYGFLDFPQFFFANRFYISITNYRIDDSSLPLENGYYINLSRYTGP